MKYITLIAGYALISGCATFVDGSSQDITLTSNVDGAKCSISQNGQETIPAVPVPATHTIGKRAGDLIVTCSAEGYETETVALIAGKHPMAVTGMMLTGVLNVGTDAISHSWHEYQDSAYVHLRKKSVL